MAGLSGVINVNKPKGITSHDVVYRLRRILGIKKIGHTGTLDPDAEGVLPMCVGRATKTADMLTALDKEYVAELTLGTATDTQDSSGTPVRVCDMESLTVSDADVKAAAEKFLGEISQVPPMYSAIKIGGKKLYELARSGIEVEREPRRVFIQEIELTELKPSCENVRSVRMRVACSKGTYIRTLCNDIGEALGTYGHMSALVRTKSGRFRIEDAYTLSEIEEMYSQGDTSFLTPTDEVFSEYEAVTVSDSAAFRIMNGAQVYAPKNTIDGEIYRVYDKSGRFLTISENENGRLKILKTFYQDFDFNQE